MPTVLIIDDEDLDRKVLHSILLSAGYEVIGTARSGEEGIELSRTLKPDLVTIDLMMPKMNGMEVLDKLRRSSAPMAFVTDEYGDVMGIITQHDLLEAIAGEFLSVEEDDAWAIQREDGSWLLDGLTPLPILIDTLALGPLPAEVEEHIAAIEPGGGHLVVEGQRLIERGESLWQPAELPENVAAVGKRGRLIWR